jgi:uncharacterized protein
MTSSSHIHHAIDYIEINVTEIEKSKQFYGRAFQWQFTDYGPDYAGIRKVTGEAGGLRRVEQVRTGGPLVILYSNHLEQSYESVCQAGGNISVEIFSFPGGRRFQFLDPSGNELAVWSDQ